MPNLCQLPVHWQRNQFAFSSERNCKVELSTTDIPSTYSINKIEMHYFWYEGKDNFFKSTRERELMCDVLRESGLFKIGVAETANRKL